MTVRDPGRYGQSGALSRRYGALGNAGTCKRFAVLRCLYGTGGQICVNDEADKAGKLPEWRRRVLALLWDGDACLSSVLVVGSVQDRRGYVYGTAGGLSKSRKSSRGFNDNNNQEQTKLQITKPKACEREPEQHGEGGTGLCCAQMTGKWLVAAFARRKTEPRDSLMGLSKKKEWVVSSAWQGRPHSNPSALRVARVREVGRRVQVQQAWGESVGGGAMDCLGGGGGGGANRFCGGSGIVLDGPPVWDLHFQSSTSLRKELAAFQVQLD
ncbi:hypothetical protein QBC35DRAFT_530917 [Podospora australis]|uniref:Uncharacterized protein n=1 Tax=Podospora australis TaxID=1536484 RepID=A0AAN7AL10_9PEZI|nr:hypothetical protein QBC35DRAFT_530917 [Podospora australis]